MRCGSQVMAMNESPVFLLMNIKPRLQQKELPVLLYESGALWHTAPAGLWQQAST